MNPLKLIGLVRFESMIALILSAVPIALQLADDRGSISAYHDMDDPRWFFVPLTAAAMMLITNALVRYDSHAYNATLGLLLIGVVMFDHDDGSAVVHFACAVSFVVLALVFAALMFTHYISVLRRYQTPRWVFAVISAAAVAAAVGLAALLLDPPLFWVESVAVWIIALHYLLHALWEVRRPDDHTEPPTVLERLWPWLYRLVVAILSPLSHLWRWLNAERKAAARELVRKT